MNYLRDAPLNNLSEYIKKVLKQILQNKNGGETRTRVEPAEVELLLKFV